jgi:FkbM family methyltransferase
MIKFKRRVRIGVATTARRKAHRVQPAAAVRAISPELAERPVRRQLKERSILFKKKPFVRWTIVVAELVGTILISFYLGARFGMIFQFQKTVYELPTAENARSSARTLLRLQPGYGQFQQDLWVALAIGHGKKNGYYVDVGSADGVVISNTNLLDQMGWKGVCIDPFPRNMQSRTCQVFRQPVSSESGKKVQFRAAGDLGGIESTLGKHKDQIAASPMVAFVTATLDEILEKARAPNWIDYMNIDVEGAEYDVLRGFSLDRYNVGAFTIEHNYEVEKRESIRKLMEAKGYVRVRSWEVDDWYVHRNLASQYRTFISYSSRQFMY